ncbi:hypothetical protein [Clostridium acetobutylicum]|uniref:hypothetical protein n=1 Tax=Clostridium acetobutylicum TaxID=1488 RepID=UPI0009C6F3AC|nr:hypothetical protein [Clostridium acetobutylicum]OOL96659.1 hypothetical protein CLACE_26620 [Clostridium acetobutylicum]OOM06882.1 hypothetical protein CLABU_14250 [Clostridium acetobutylicum]
MDAFIANANYAENPNNQKAFQDDWKSISKNYTASQKRMAEEAKEKAKKEGLIGLVWDGLQICAGTALVVTGVGTGFGVVLIAGGVNSAINHASMATTGRSFNIVGNLTNPQVRAQFGVSLGNWWKQVRSGNAYAIGQTTATVASLFVGGEDIGVAVSKASKAESLLGKVGTFSKSIAVSSVENVKSLLPKVKGALSDVGTASVTFAKTFGKTFAEESGKYANTCFDVLGAVATGVKIGGKAIVAGGKEVKSVFKVVKAQENGIAEVVSNPEAHNYVNYIKYKGELAKSELKEMYPDFVAKKNSKIAQTSDALLKKELEFAQYGELEKIPFDNLTGHHMPSNYYMKEKFNIDMDDSLAFNLEQLSPGVGGRHRRTFTYGFKGRGKELYLNLMPRDALAFDSK